MVKNKLFYLILLFFIILTTSVSAYYTIELGEYHTTSETITRNEFKAHTGPYTICAGETKIIPIWLKNKLDAKQFTFKLENIGFATLSGNSFILNPDQEGVLFLIVKPPFNLEENTSLNLDIYTNNQLTLRLPVELSIEKCYGVNVDIKKDKEDICACELHKYDVEIENKGKSDELFKVYLDAPDFADIGKKFVAEINDTIDVTEKSLMIKSLNKTNLKIDVNPTCNTSGVFNIRLYAELERGTNIVNYDDLELNIIPKEDCYKPEIIAKDIKLGYGKYHHPIKIRNTGIKKATYSMLLEAPDWINIEEESLTLAEDQEKEIYLFLNPHKEIEVGDYDVKLLLNVADLEYSETLSVDLKEKNKFFESIKQSLNYYKYYVYLIIIILVIFFLFLPIIRRKLKAISRKKVKRPKKLIFSIVILAIIAVLFLILKKIFSSLGYYITYYKYYLLVGIVVLILLLVLFKFIFPMTKRKLQESKIKKEKLIELKQVAEKEVEKIERIQKRKKTFSFIYMIASLLILAALIAYSLYTLFTPVKFFFIRYIYYILIGLGALVFSISLLIIIKMIFRKRKLKKLKKAKIVAKKIVKKRRKINRRILKRLTIIVISLIILAGVVYSFIYFNLLRLIKDFLILYLYYIIAGVVISILIILFLMYAKKIINFFSEEDKKK